jgi:hypothetical protein
LRPTRREPYERHNQEAHEDFNYPIPNSLPLAQPIAEDGEAKRQKEIKTIHNIEVLKVGYRISAEHCRIVVNSKGTERMMKIGLSEQ